VNDFLAQRRLALVGLSHHEQDFSRTLFQALRDHGYDMVPVNPAMQEVAGVRCYARVQDIMPKVDGALVMTPAAQAEQVVRDCIEAGISRVWLHRGTGPGAVSPQAIELCLQSGIKLVAGQCPFMFLPEPAWFHRAHRYLKKLRGTYPTTAASAELRGSR
jgi:hypothetical protein